MYYSATTNGAYDDPANYSEFPSDAKKISDDIYFKCFLSRPPDKMVAPDDEGMPILIDMPGPSHEELCASVRFLRDEKLRLVYDAGCASIQRKIRIAVSDADMLAELYGRLAELDRYAEELTNIPQQEGFPNTIIWPEDPVL